MLWLNTTPDQKYKAKQAVDSFFVRLGDVSSALLVAGLSGILGLGVRTFALVNVLLIGAWLALVLAISREQARRGAQPEARAPAE
jgi:AAA family ATP:ADP antiporter